MFDNLVNNKEYLLIGIVVLIFALIYLNIREQFADIERTMDALEEELELNKLGNIVDNEIEMFVDATEEHNT